MTNLYGLEKEYVVNALKSAWKEGFTCNEANEGYDLDSADEYALIMFDDMVRDDALIPSYIVAEAKKLMQEAIDDIIVYVEENYPKESRDQYPSYQRRYDRDCEIADKMKLWIEKAHYSKLGKLT